MQDAPKIGSLILDGDRRRDAIHVAVAPVTARERLVPGQRVKLQKGSTEVVEAAFDEEGIGIVDPFLPLPVAEGQRFWLFLYPNTVTSLRHVWTHPAFQAKIPDLEKK